MPMTPAERYHTDPYFHALVDQFRVHLEACETTPSEIRAAAMLAAQMIEERRTKIELEITGDRIHRNFLSDAKQGG